MDSEVWKDIPGYEGAYQVSSLGRVRSLEREVHRRLCGKDSVSLRPGRVLRQSPNRTGYMRVALRKDGGTRTHEVQTLVALAFLGPRHKWDEQVRHLDGDRKNNAAENLAYGTRSENQIDVYRYRGYHHKLTPEDAKEIRERRARGETGRSLAREFGCSESNISEIMHGRSFAWLQ